MSLAELVKLLEAMAVDDLLQLAVGIVEQVAGVVEDHQLSVRGRIGMPRGMSIHIGVSGVCELCPYVAHHVGKLSVFIRDDWQVLLRQIEGVETIVQLVAVHRTF